MKKLITVTFLGLVSVISISIWSRRIEHSPVSAFQAPSDVTQSILFHATETETNGPNSQFSASSGNSQPLARLGKIETHSDRQEISDAETRSLEAREVVDDFYTRLQLALQTETKEPTPDSVIHQNDLLSLIDRARSQPDQVAAIQSALAREIQNPRHGKEIQDKLRKLAEWNRCRDCKIEERVENPQ